MSRNLGLMSLFLTGCAGANPSQIASAALEPGTLDILGAISRAQNSAGFASSLTEFKKKTVSGWVDSARAGLIEKALSFNGQNFAGLKSQIKFNAELNWIVDSFSQRFNSVGTILRAYGVPKDLQVAPGDVDDYLRLATAGIHYAKSGKFPYQGDMDGQLYLRALNAGLVFSTAAKGTQHEALASSATVGYIYAIHGLLYKEASSRAALALTGDTATVTDADAATRIVEKDHLSLLACGGTKPVQNATCGASGQGAARAGATRKATGNSGTSASATNTTASTTPAGDTPSLTLMAVDASVQDNGSAEASDGTQRIVAGAGTPKPPIAKKVPSECQKGASAVKKT